MKNKIEWLRSGVATVAIVAVVLVMVASLENHIVGAQLNGGGEPAVPPVPCDTDAVIAYPGVNEPPVVKSWSAGELRSTWKPPSCTGWTETGFTTLVTTAARFTFAGDGAELLRHLGAISTRSGMRYWSTTHKRWQTLILEAHALTTPPHSEQRGDFNPDELRDGQVIYFEQADNLTGKGTFRMHIIEASANRIAFDIENVSTMRYAFLTVLHPGDMQSMYALERDSDDVWRFYGVMRVGVNANKKMAGNESSAINRAAAFYRYVAGIPTDREPPAAR